MAMTPEERVKKPTHAFLHEIGCIRAGTTEDKWPETPTGLYYMPVKGTPIGVNGIPDFVGFVQTMITADMVGQSLPVFLAVETKASGKRNNTSANQDARIKEITSAGGIALVIDDVEQLKEVLDA